MPDLNWLLSTFAHQRPVIVAIVGGFLVSRLVTLSAERNALVSRRAEIEVLVKMKQEERKALVNENEAEADELVSEILDDLVEARGEMSLEMLLQQHGDPWIQRTKKLSCTWNA
jgi:hypothetical protein